MPVRFKMNYCDLCGLIFFTTNSFHSLRITFRFGEKYNTTNQANSLKET